MSRRLPIDAHLIGYWGFDEALETDTAIDGTGNSLDLTVNASSGTAPGRVGNSRLFDGASSYASISSALLRLTGDLTLMVWAKLNSYNPSGTQLRALISCGGPTTGDNLLYGVAVTLSGQLTYRHTSASGEVVVSTPPGTIRTNQFYFIVIRRIANGPNQDIEIYVDNVLKSTTVTVGGSPSSMPVPPPLPNPSAIFSVGRSQREPDFAFWHGAVDELSVHDVARPYHAYLIEAYYRASIRSETTKLTTTNTVVAVSSYDMGAGVRWWCIERDQDLYVVKESPFGNFGPETRLTTVGGGNSSLTGSPELIYDAANDTLYVFFVSGNRIYKLTANSTDDPATVNMPYTADTGSIIKSVDNIDGGRLGDSSTGQRTPLESDFIYVNRTPIKLSLAEAGNLGDSSTGGSYSSVVQGTPNAPNIEIMTLPTYGLGLVIGPRDSETGGYMAYRLEGGVATALPSPILLPDHSNRYFVPLSSRPYGMAYYAEALTVEGRPSGVFTPVIVDFFNETFESPTGVIQYGRNGSGTDNGSLGDSSIGARDILVSDFSYVNRAPLKLSTQDPSVDLLGDSSTGQTAIVNQGSITVVAQ
jgi:hypothetical protein